MADPGWESWHSALHWLLTPEPNRAILRTLSPSKPFTLLEPLQATHTGYFFSPLPSRKQGLCLFPTSRHPTPQHLAGIQAQSGFITHPEITPRLCSPSRAMLVRNHLCRENQAPGTEECVGREKSTVDENSHRLAHSTLRLFTRGRCWEPGASRKQWAPPPLSLWVSVTVLLQTLFGSLCFKLSLAPQNRSPGLSMGNVAHRVAPPLQQMHPSCSTTSVLQLTYDDVLFCLNTERKIQFQQLVMGREF